MIMTERRALLNRINFEKFFFSEIVDTELRQKIGWAITSTIFQSRGGITSTRVRVGGGAWGFAYRECYDMGSVSQPVGRSPLL